MLDHQSPRQLAKASKIAKANKIEGRVIPCAVCDQPGGTYVSRFDKEGNSVYVHPRCVKYL